MGPALAEWRCARRQEPKTDEKDFSRVRPAANGLFENRLKSWNFGIIFYQNAKSTCDFALKTHF